jgi:two-component system, chemotaxis family, chemotaxis protein CheY
MSYQVLIVDDSLTARTYMVKALGLSGAEIGRIHQARNGREALEVLYHEWIDIVLADINMPEMNGVELVHKMNQDGLMRTVPVIVVSTDRSQPRIEDLKAAGVRFYLNKPFTPEKLKFVIERILGPQELTDLAGDVCVGPLYGTN